LLAGSVSRAVASRGECPVLVVREAPRAVRRFVVGYDGCADAERAVDLLTGLDPRGCRAVLVNAMEHVSLPATLSRLPSGARDQVVRAAVAHRDEHHRKAGAMLEPAVARLKRAGWSARYEVREAPPLDALLRASRDWRADVLVVGARSVSDMQRVLLGSVANGVLDRSRVPVLIVR
jgi:nucleotide-binding universal stress UspA family protein